MTCVERSPEKRVYFSGQVVVDTALAVAAIYTKQRNPLYFNVQEN